MTIKTSAWAKEFKRANDEGKLYIVRDLLITLLSRFARDSEKPPKTILFTLKRLDGLWCEFVKKTQAMPWTDCSNGDTLTLKIDAFRECVAQADGGSYRMAVHDLYDSIGWDYMASLCPKQDSDNKIIIIEF